jgi:hypothetical protein
VARLVLPESPEGARTVLIGDFRQTLLQIALIDPYATLIEVLLGVVAHDVHAVFVILVTHLRADVIATLLVVAARHRNIINGLLVGPNDARGGDHWF